MSPETKRSSVFIFDSTPDFNLFKVGALSASIIGFAASIREAYTSKDPFLLLLTALSLGIAWIVSRSIFKSMPSRIEASPDSVILYDGPGMTVQIYRVFPVRVPDLSVVR